MMLHKFVADGPICGAEVVRAKLGVETLGVRAFGMATIEVCLACLRKEAL